MDRISATADNLATADTIKTFKWTLESIYSWLNWFSSMPLVCLQLISRQANNNYWIWVKEVKAKAAISAWIPMKNREN